MPNTVTSPSPLTILHTSDWHLGRRLYGRMRYEEFEAFLAWLTETIVTHQVDVLIVAGDIFDTMTPSNKAQALYYDFLGRVSAIKVDGKPCCQHIVIVAGNHDSPTFLDAPSHVLKFLNVHVIGTACEDVAEEVLTLTNHEDEPICIIAAVPYLRDRDVRGSFAGESGHDKETNVIKGIQAHYDSVAQIAKQRQAELMATHHRHIPIIATGHLFCVGAKTTEDDGVRDLYVGTLGSVSADMFDDCFDYVALGHLHVPQRVGGCETIRYPGSPIPMGFGEARQQKQVLLVRFGELQFDETQFSERQSSFEDANNSPNPTATSKSVSQPAMTVQSHFVDDLFGFDTEESTATEEPTSETIPPLEPKVIHVDNDKNMQVVSLPIPCFQKLAQISGDLDEIAAAINALVSHKTAESVWLEVIYTGDEIVSDLREHVQALSEGLPCEILKIKNTKTYDRVLNQEMANETLQDLDELEVFNRCLDINNIAESQRDELKRAYEQILYDIRHDDSRAE